MLENPIVLLTLSLIFAAIPAAIWLYILFSKENKSKGTIALVFFVGCLTAPALLGVQYIWSVAPQFDLALFIEENVQRQTTMFIFMFMLFGAMEEIIKHYAVRVVDRRTLLIQTIGDAIRYSLAAALGFSFIENMYYLYEFWPQINLGELTGMYIFRSLFTTCAHLIFSGIFGYYFGIGKFSIEIGDQNKIVGETPWFTKFVARTFNLSRSEALKEQMILKGLTIAIAMHAIYNYLLQYNIILPVVIFVILGYSYLHFLLSRKTGSLVLITDISTKTKSRIAPKDEQVILELLGMWFKEKRYTDVIHICERLLERDPDNKVVELFKTKAIDAMDGGNVYKKILSTILKPKNTRTRDDNSVIQQYLDQKEKHSKA